MTRRRVAQIINNTNFGEINNLLSQGRDMEYIAGHYNMDLPLACSLHLEVLRVSASLSNHISTDRGIIGCPPRHEFALSLRHKGYKSVTDFNVVRSEGK